MWADLTQVILWGLGIQFVVYCTGFVAGTLKLEDWFCSKMH